MILYYANLDNHQLKAKLTIMVELMSNIDKFIFKAESLISNQNQIRKNILTREQKLEKKTKSIIKTKKVN